MTIRKAAVIGAGTMGAGIAFQLANAGVPCLLLDVVPNDLSEAESGDPRARSKLATGAIERGLKNRPLAFMSPEAKDLVEPGNVEDHIDKLAECDWVIEAVFEDLDVKRALYKKIVAHRRPGTIVSSNTSGISLHLLVDDFDEDFRKHFLITHFFNPPRYMYLLEMVRGAETLPAVYDEIRDFSEKRLGKGVVECKDTPNFIANRIGVFSMGSSCHHMQEVGLTIEEVDAISAAPMGRPKTATFKLHDLVGNDIAIMVMNNVKRLIPDDESLGQLEPPAYLTRMVEEKKLGRKSGEGFYKKVGKDILVLDLETFEYRAPEKVSFDSILAAKKGKTVAERVRLLVEGDDKAAEYAWRNLSETLIYAASRVPEISDDIVSVDRAIRWGFNWDLGPFELWDALGVKTAADRIRAEGRSVPKLVDELLAAGFDSFYSFVGEGADSSLAAYSPASSTQEVIEERAGVILLDSVRASQTPLLTNSCGSVWDLGDGVLCVEFQSKMNSISDETLAVIRDAIDLVENGDYAGLVIGNQAANFSVGANLVGLAGAAQEKNWDAISAMIKNFHQTALRIRYSAKPVVAAVQGMALGGGCEVPLACDRVQAAAESYMGLVELGVGLIPAGGGTRELACRAAEALPSSVQGDPFPFLQRAFENISQGKVSGSAHEAATLGFLGPRDEISMNRDRTIADAKRVVLTMSGGGYRPPPRRDKIRVAGQSGIAELSVILHQFHQAGYASDYDAYLVKKLIHVLCGGDVTSGTAVSEQHLLDLEREVFLELCGQEKTLERIGHMLKTGKPLRN